MKIAVMGLGEAGSLYSSAFASRGCPVNGFDPGDTPTPAGVQRCADVATTVRDADLVLSLTSAKVCLTTASAAAPHLKSGAVYADMNAASAQLKTEVAAVVQAVDARFADVAVIGSVPASGARTALIVSGPGATTAADSFSRLGAAVTDIGGAPGDASNRKLLRSSFMKGLGALIVEASAAGSAAGAQDWVRDQMAAELSGGFAALDRLLDGTKKHASRRSVEMAASMELLDSLGIRPVLASATAEAHRALADAAESGVDDVLAAYAGLAVANIGDARQRMGMVDSGIRAMWKGARLVGRARTVWTRAGDNKALHEALEKVRPDEVIVINGQGDPNRALMGELIAERARSRGCVGMIIDGAARDIEVLEEIGFGVWARAASPAGPYKDGPGRTDIPVAVGGVVCSPGDLVVADDDGVIVIPAAEAFTSLAGGRAVEADEARRRAAIVAARDVA